MAGKAPERLRCQGRGVCIHRSEAKSLERSERSDAAFGQEGQANLLSFELRTGNRESKFSESGMPAPARTGIVSGMAPNGTLELPPLLGECFGLTANLCPLDREVKYRTRLFAGL